MLSSDAQKNILRISFSDKRESEATRRRRKKYENLKRWGRKSFLIFIHFANGNFMHIFSLRRKIFSLETRVLRFPSDARRKFLAGRAYLGMAPWGRSNCPWNVLSRIIFFFLLNMFDVEALKSSSDKTDKRSRLRSYLYRNEDAFEILSMKHFCIRKFLKISSELFIKMLKYGEGEDVEK